MADHPLFSISVVTPEGPAFEGDAEMLIVPGDAVLALSNSGETVEYAED